MKLQLKLSSQREHGYSKNDDQFGLWLLVELGMCRREFSWKLREIYWVTRVSLRFDCGLDWLLLVMHNGSSSILAGMSRIRSSSNWDGWYFDFLHPISSELIWIVTCGSFHFITSFPRSGQFWMWKISVLIISVILTDLKTSRICVIVNRFSSRCYATKCSELHHLLVCILVSVFLLKSLCLCVEQRKFDSFLSVHGSCSYDYFLMPEGMNLSLKKW